MTFEDFSRRTVCRYPNSADARKRFERIPKKRHPELERAMDSYFYFVRQQEGWYKPKHAVYWLGGGANAWESWIDREVCRRGLGHPEICRESGCRFG